MYEKIAWDNFMKTGDIESFLEYKKIMELYNFKEVLEEKGELSSELDKSKGDSNKGSNI